MSERLPLTPLSVAILVALGREELHGYALMQEVEEGSGGHLRPGTGSLYAALQRLMNEGWIRESPNRPRPDEDSRRKYYQITEEGREVVGDELRRLVCLVDDARAHGLIPAEGL